MAFGSAINLLDIRVGYLVEADMAVFALQLAVNGGGKFFVIDIKKPFGPAFIISSDAGIPVAQQTILCIGYGIGSHGHAGRQQQ
jgi:hypothetical protein